MLHESSGQPGAFVHGPPPVAAIPFGVPSATSGQPPVAFGMLHVSSGQPGAFVHGPPPAAANPFGVPSATSGSGFGFGAPQIVHDGITCDSCKAIPVKGPRYRCSMCADYDLCQVCMNTRAQVLSNPSGGHHDSSHIFLRIDDPKFGGNYTSVINRSVSVHSGTQCNSCNGSIVGFRFHCTQCVVDLCEACEVRGVHDINHTRMKIVARAGSS